MLENKIKQERCQHQLTFQTHNLGYQIENTIHEKNMMPNKWKVKGLNGKKKLHKINLK